MRTVVQNWQKLTTIPKMVTSTPSPKREATKKSGNPQPFIAGALTVVSNSLWRMACPHFIDLSPSKLIETSTTVTQITTNTLIHSLTFHLSLYLTHSALPVLFFVACWWKWCLCVLASVDHPLPPPPGPICITFRRISILIGDYWSAPVKLKMQPWRRAGLIYIYIYHEYIWYSQISITVRYPRWPYHHIWVHSVSAGRLPALRPAK